MNRVTAAQIKAFLKQRKEMEMELMMRKARYHGAEQDIPERNSQRVEELERQLMFQDALMALLTQGEQMLVQEHVLEEHTWETLGKLYAERWYYEPTKRALQMRLKRAIDKLTEVCDRRLEFSFLIECGELKAKQADK